MGLKIMHFYFIFLSTFTHWQILSYFNVMCPPIITRRYFNYFIKIRLFFLPHRVGLSPNYYVKLKLPNPIRSLEKVDRGSSRNLMTHGCLTTFTNLQLDSSPSITKPNQFPLIQGGFQTAFSRKHNYHDSCPLCKG
jgi:hypothetical protein